MRHTQFNMPFMIQLLTLWLITGSGAHVASAQDVEQAEVTTAKEVEDSKKDAKEKEDSTEPAGRTEYMGRKIAQTMHYTGARWLTRETRERQEDCTTMLKNLGAKKGMTICDLGCGNGFYSLRLAEIVGKDGKILAVDIQPEMLHLLELRAKEENVSNIRPVLGTLSNPHLPTAAVDLILCVDVYHELSHPERMLDHLHKSLKPDGQIVLVEFRAEDPDVPIKKLHKMSKDQCIKELAANGFALKRSFDELPWQHMLFFGKDIAVLADSRKSGSRAEMPDKEAENLPKFGQQ